MDDVVNDTETDFENVSTITEKNLLKKRSTSHLDKNALKLKSDKGIVNVMIDKGTSSLLIAYRDKEPAM